MLFIFVVFVAIAFFWERSGNNQEITPSATPQVSILDLTLAEIDRLEILSNTGSNIALVKDGAGLWTIDEPQGEVDTRVDLGSKIDNLLTLHALSVLATPPDADATGLEMPAYTIAISLSSGEQKILEIGKGTVTGSGYYVQAGGKVFVVDKFNVDSLVSLIDNPPYNTPTVTATPEEVSTPGPITPTP